MRYDRFEVSVITVAAVAIAGTVATTLHDATRVVPDLTMALLLIAVIAGAVHWGRRGGMSAAMIASAIYVLISVPELMQSESLANTAFLNVAIRVGTFGLLGILGGEFFSRVNHMMSRLGRAEVFDEWGHAFSQAYAVSALERTIAGYLRYRQPFSIVLLTVSSDVTKGMSATRTRTLIRSVSNFMRGDLRMVDELARLDDGRYLSILPSTGADGGRVVAARLGIGVRELLGAKETSVEARFLCSEDDLAAIQGLLYELSAAEEDAEQPAQDSSGEYKSEGLKVLKPASERTSSAPGASTLKMSTAALPDGSTKQ
jgi:hypothetical protein